MEPSTINVTELRLRTREIMERVKYKGETFLVETFGQPTAMVVNIEQFRDMGNKVVITICQVEGAGADVQAADSDILTQTQ